MKRFLSLSFILLCVLEMHAQLSRVNTDLETMQIPQEQIASRLTQILSVPGTTTFEQTKVLVDNNGYSHTCFQQYVYGFMVEGAQILAHAHNGVVINMNGAFLPNSKHSALPKRLKTNNEPKGNDKDIIIIADKRTGKGDFCCVKKVISEELGAFIYLDVETGDTVKQVSFINDAQVKMTTNTIYYGRQQLSVDQRGQWMAYSVNQPRIETINATNVDFSADNESVYNSQIQACNTFYETQADSLNSYIASLRFENKSLWWQDTEDGVNIYPDLYIKIFNSSNDIVYQSPVYQDWKGGDIITFNPLFYLDGDTYTIQLYDQDLLMDDCAGGFTISSRTKGIGTISLPNFNVTVNVTGNPIRDAHWGMEQTLAFYKNMFNRDSYDGLGATVYQFVNPFLPQSLPNNAFAKSKEPYCMIYGLGDGMRRQPYVPLDIMAHEFTHIVTAHNIAGGLEYLGEAGALNEGFSDIFGVLVEKYAFGKCDWTISEKNVIGYPCVRSLRQPEIGQPAQPDTYGTNNQYWIDPSNTEDDHGGVHTNSGVLNHWFYLLCQGGRGTNSNGDEFDVVGIGTDKGAHIAYNTLMYQLTYSASFADAREGSINAVKLLYGANSQEHQAVVNAWYAVGVGEEYFSLKPGKYVVVANRNKTNDNNWYYMTADLGTASNKRLQAVTTNTANINNVKVENLNNKYIWDLEFDGANWKLKNNNQYVSWTSGNTANLASSGNALSCDMEDKKVHVHFSDGNSERYLSLNGTTGNNYFAFYSGTNQVTDLYFLPYKAPDTCTIRAIIPQDWGTTIKAWVWNDNSNGAWANLTYNNGWYEYTYIGNRTNIIFVNGSTWNGDNNQTVDLAIEGSACLAVGNETEGKRSSTLLDCPKEITVKAKMPDDWGTTVSAWVWDEQSIGEWVTLSHEDDWYSFTRNCGMLNVIFVNGTTWNGDENQTVNISTKYDACYQICNNNGKRIGMLIDCESKNETNPDTPTDDTQCTIQGSTNNHAIKMIDNGQLYIRLSNGNTYNAQGTRLK